MSTTPIKAAVAQIAPVLLDRERTLAKVATRVEEAAQQGCAIVGFGEALVPGYPVWLSRTDAARFDEPEQKRIHSLYVEQAVDIEAGHLNEVCRAAAYSNISVVLGIVERAPDRGGHSLYCSRVYIDSLGQVASVHRKLMPTYEERLAWAPGDGAGLVVHDLAGFRVGALNCWENWIPLARAALHAQGENVHFCIWPGSDGNTKDATRFFAMEARSFVLSACGIYRPEDVPDTVPMRDRIVGDGAILHNGGSCVANPDGSWLLEPVTGREELCVVELDRMRVFEERQNFDPSGHYSRADVLRLTVDRRRQSVLEEAGD